MLKLNVGLTKKIGQKNYGSKGASANVELELDSSIITEPERLRERIKHVFAIVRTAVEEELNDTQPAPEHNGTSATDVGQINGRGPVQGKTSPRRATANQARALHVLADRQGIDLPGLLRQRYGLDQAGDLSITEASAMIDELKCQTHGAGGPR